MAVAGGTKSLADFAQANGLTYSVRADLPAEGSTLPRDTGAVEGAAIGALPGGIEGTLAHFTYSYTVTDSDNNSRTEHRRLTLVVASVPVSIGFVPYLGFSRGASHLVATAGGTKMRRIDLGGAPALKGASAFIYAGCNENWQAQLFSPALLEWLARSEDDFGFELANGVLVAGRSEYLNGEADLRALCEDAAHLAAVIDEEAQEAVDTGGAEANAARDPDASDPKMEAALARVELDPPAHLHDAEQAFRSDARGTLGTLLYSLGLAIGLILILNVPGIALPIVLSIEGEFLLLAAIEVALVVIAFVFFFRDQVRSRGNKYAEEAFFRGYARSRGLTLEEPLRFMATHSDAGLPFKPDRVMTGPLPGGGEGSLAMSGDGMKRKDRIAVVGGPAGPVAESELEAEAPGLSAKDLDTYLEQLAGEVREAQQHPTT